MNIDDLLVEETKERIYSRMIEIAQSLNVATDSWQPGDPTRSQYHVDAELLWVLEKVAAGLARSAFLDTSSGMWLVLKANQDYGVTVPEASQATGEATVTSGSAEALYTFDPGDVIFRNSTSGATYRNTAAFSISGAGSQLVAIKADAPGSDGNAAPGEIDELVTAVPGVTVNNALSVLGADRPNDAAIRSLCRSKLGAYSLGGPADAYEYVAQNAELTGVNGIRCRVFPDTSDGTVTVVLAGPNGAVTLAERDAVEAAIVQYANGTTNTPEVVSATNVVVAVPYALWIYSDVNKTVAEIEEAVEAKLEDMVSDHPIGGDVIPPAGGILSRSLIESTILSAFPDHIFRVSVGLMTDATIPQTGVATLGAITATISLVAPP